MPDPSAVECIWPVGAELGEGPVWIAAERAVYFVDIKGLAIHRLEIETGARTFWPTPAQAGFIVPARGGGLICGLQDGLYRFDPASGGFARISAVEADRPGNRINDGFVDPEGRLWFGTMHDGENAATGSLYSWTGPGDPILRDTDYSITNGPAVSPDGRTLYHTDSAAKTIYAFDLASDGALSGKRVFARTDDSHPDGMAVDAEGSVWVALFGGWRIDRYSPAGAVIGSVALPCANITKLAFGGEDLRTAYVTTARLHLSARGPGEPAPGGRPVPVPRGHAGPAAGRVRFLKREISNAAAQHPVHHRRPVARRLPVDAGPPGDPHAASRRPGRGRGAVRQAFRQCRALRPQPRLPAHRHVSAEPPLGDEWHTIGRAPHQLGAGGGQGRL